VIVINFTLADGTPVSVTVNCVQQADGTVVCS